MDFHQSKSYVAIPYKAPFSYKSRLFHQKAAQQGRDRVTHSAITGGNYSKIQYHSQQFTRHHYGNTCDCAEYKDKVMGHIWTSHIHRPL